MRLLCFVCMCVCAWASTARGNGRLPTAGQLVLSPSDPQLLLLRTTFGVLLSQDHGASFAYVCERAMHYGGAQDPPYALTREGRVLLVSSLGFVRGSVGATHFDQIVPLRGGRDLSVEGAGPTLVLASTFQQQDDAGAYAFRSQLYQADGEGSGLDGGRWLPPDLLYETVESVPGDPTRLVLSGAAHGARQADRAVLSLSVDGGEHFHRLPIALAAGEASVYIAGIERTATDARVYLRTFGGALTPGRLLVGEFSDLYARARRGGAGQEGGVREVLRLSTPMLGFALDHAGSVYAGGEDGVFRADVGDLQFEKRSALRARCLAAGPGELWACADQAAGFLLGRSTDQGRSFAPSLTLGEVDRLVPSAEIVAACATELARLRAEYAALPPPSHPQRSAPRVAFALALAAGAALSLLASALIVRWIRRARRGRSTR